MRTIWKRGLLVTVLAAAMPLAACDDDITGDGDAEGEGQVSVMLTDAAGDIRTAIVTVNSIYLQGGSGNDANGRVYVLGSADASADLEANLTDLSNSMEEIVDSEPVPAGSYQQLRIVIDDACIVVEGEGGEDEVYATSGFEACGAADGNLQTTSTTSAGIRINFAGSPLVIEEGDEEAFLVDFDVSQSFHASGNSGQWVMEPVIKGAELDAAASVTVVTALGTNVTLPEGVVLTGFTARLTNSEGSNEEVALGADGKATFRHLIPGQYTVTLLAPGGFVVTTDPVSPTVNVTSGGNVTTNFTITGITTAGI